MLCLAKHRHIALKTYQLQRAERYLWQHFHRSVQHRLRWFKSTSVKNYVATTQQNTTFSSIGTDEEERSVTTYLNGKQWPSRNLWRVSRGGDDGSIVFHFLVESPGTLQEKLEEMLEISPHRSRELIADFGSIYLSVFPRKLQVGQAFPCPTQQQVYDETRNFVKSQLHLRPEYQNFYRLRRVMNPNTQVHRGNHIRASVHPRTFPTCASMTNDDWVNRILAQQEDFLVVDKPSGVSTIPTTDNAKQNLAWRLGDVFGYVAPMVPLFAECEYRTSVAKEHRAEIASLLSNFLPSIPNPDTKWEDRFSARPAQLLYTQQRLDKGTCGVILLGRHKEFATWLQKRLQDRKGIVKKYKALCIQQNNSTIPSGKLVHYLELAVRDKYSLMKERTVAHKEPGESRKESSMIVEHEKTFVAQPEHNKFALVELVIELQTGRTHQIRAQLAECGLAIVGDDLYPRNLATVGCKFGKMALQACKLTISNMYNSETKTSSEETATFVASQPWWEQSPSSALQVAQAQFDAMNLAPSHSA